MTPSLRRWLHARQRPARYAQLEELLRNQAMSRAQVLRRQREDFESIVAHAAAATDYYGATLAPVLTHKGRDWLANDLPILAKTDVVAHLPALLAREADRDGVKIGHTGGSTGKPLAFWYDDAKHELMRAGMMRSYMMSGWRPGEKIVNFWGARQDTVAGGVFGAGLGAFGASWYDFGASWYDFGASLYDLIAAEKTLPAHEFTEANLHAWARFILAYRPVLLQGYVSILAALARFVIDRRLAVPRSLRGVYATAEVLDGRQRELIEQAFGCKVFNQYGSREIPNIACECRHGRMHVFTDMVYLESLRADGEDRLLVTSLTNRLMPFIRYDIGDSGRLLDGECDCGSPFPLMEMGMCRKNDLIRTPAGKRVHPSYFNGLLYGLTQIEQYQFIQDEPGRIALNVVSTRPLDDGIVTKLRESIRRDVDAGMALELNYVTAIARSVSGKHRFVVSYCT